MARWLLTEPPYLNVPGTRWEYKETDRTSGKQKSMTLPVPAFLDPRDEADWNYSQKSGPFQAEQGFTVLESFGIVVCYEGKGQGRDIIFVGPPTPGMLPLDTEAKKISDKESPKWIHPIEGLPGTFSDNLLESLQMQVAAVASKASVPKDDGKLDKLMEAMTMMAQENAKLIAALSTRRA